MTQAILSVVGASVLGVVFLTAASGKLTDRVGTRDAIKDFGVPGVLVQPVALALPVAELAVVILLLFSSTRVDGAAGALGLLALFSAAIAANLARGRTPACHCFGQLHSTPVGWRTLSRNGVLAGVSAVVLVAGRSDPGAGLFAWIGAREPAGILAGCAMLAVGCLAAVGGLAFVSVMRSHGRLLLRLDVLQEALRAAGIEVPQDGALIELGRDPGTPAPSFIADTVSGGRTSLDDLLEPGLPLLLAFTSPSCGPCRALQPILSRWQQEHSATLTIAVMSDGEPDAIRAELEEHELASVLIDSDLDVYRDYQASGTPSAVLISPDGLLASYVAAGAEAIEELVAHSLGAAHEPDGLPIGAMAPVLDLRDLNGQDVSLADPDGGSTLLVFWNPGCGFCQSIRDDLRGWERNAGLGAPRLVVVSSGDPDALREDGFRSVVALDSEYTAGDAFGAGGTPTAVMLDGEGRIASGLASGGPAVLALATSHHHGTVGTRIAGTR